MTRPFRWDVTRREQLGTLAHGELAESYPQFRDDLRRCCARVLSIAGDARLIFVGRSPESLFDYLSGALADTSWAERALLLNLSLRRVGEDGEALDTESWTAIQRQVGALGLDPAAIASGSRPAALIDLIYTGATLGTLIEFFIAWATEAGVDASAVDAGFGW